MYIKVFDCESEVDLELIVNEYLAKIDSHQVVDIKYQVATLYDGRDQVYCFSCLIILK